MLTMKEAAAALDGNECGREDGAETFVHTFHDRLNGGTYKSLAVRHGLGLISPVVMFCGRLCYTTKGSRTRSAVGRRFFDTVSVHYLDGSVEVVPEGKFNAKAKVAPLEMDRAS